MKNQEFKKKFRQNQLKTKEKWKQSQIKISKELRDIIHGYVMSDGYIRNGVLTVDQSIKQKLFVLWLYEKLQPVITGRPIKEVSRIHPTTQTQSRSLRFFTKAVLQGFHNMWYEPINSENSITKYKKKLPKTLNCFFNSTFISVWYGADGTKIIGSKGAKFELTSFTVEERLKLKTLFLKKFNIQTQIIKSGVSKKGTIQWALKIDSKQYQNFRDLITKLDLIPKIFPYKLHKKI